MLFAILERLIIFQMRELEMTRRIEDWARDTGLYNRLREAIRILARSKGRWKDRARIAFEFLGPVRSADFPAEWQKRFEVVEALREKSIWHGPIRPVLSPSTLSPKERVALVDAIFDLYEAMTIARAKVERR